MDYPWHKTLGLLRHRQYLWAAVLLLVLTSVGLAAWLVTPLQVWANELARNSLHVVWASDDSGDGLLAAGELVGPAGATRKSLSTNFTLVNLVNGNNTANISYYKPDGSQWRTPEVKQFTTLGEPATYRQYTDPALSAGYGSVVIGSQGALGAVVTISATSNLTSTRGAYTAVINSTNRSYVPVVLRQGTLDFHPAVPGQSVDVQNPVFLPLIRGRILSAAERASSQIVVQNAGTTATTFTIKLVNNLGLVVYETPARRLEPGASFSYDLADDGSAPYGQFSALVESAADGQVAVLSNLFVGPHALLSFVGADSGRTLWYLPFYAARLANGFSVAIAVQNTGSSAIAAGALTILCRPTEGSSVDLGFNWTNSRPIPSLATFGVDPLSDIGIPSGFFGNCSVTSPQPVYTVALIRSTVTSEAAAYEGIDGTDNNSTVVSIFYKRLPNGVASAEVFQNMGLQPAKITLTYKRSPETPSSVVNCDATVHFEIPVGGTLVQNHRVPNGALNSTPWVDDGCSGTIIASADSGSAAQPIGGVAMVTNIKDVYGDFMMAYRLFEVP